MLFDNREMNAIENYLYATGHDIIDESPDVDYPWNFVSLHDGELIFTKLIVMPKDSEDFGPDDHVTNEIEEKMILFTNANEDILPRRTLRIRYDVFRMIPNDNGTAMVRHAKDCDFKRGR